MCYNMTLVYLLKTNNDATHYAYVNCKHFIVSMFLYILLMHNNIYKNIYKPYIKTYIKKYK